MAYDTDTIARMPRGRHWQDWVNLVLAVWLFISPWIISFGATSGTSGYDAYGSYGAGGGAAAAPAASAAAWNAWIFGVIVFLVALSALGRMRPWQEWINLLIGIWLFVAPWVLGFTGLPGASWDHWIVGALIFIFAVWSLGAGRPATLAGGDVPPRA